MRGFTLIELMVAISVVGLLMLIGIPKAQAAFRQTQLRSARNAVINLYQQARTRAITEGRLVTLNLDGTSVWVTAQPRRTVGGAAPCLCDTVGTVQSLTAQYGVTLVPGGATYTVDARGLSTTPENKIVFTKSGARDSFTITGYGRIAK